MPKIILTGVISKECWDKAWELLEKVNPYYFPAHLTNRIEANLVIKTYPHKHIALMYNGIADTSVVMDSDVFLKKMSQEIVIYTLTK
ncbi:MAG: hypothetical protein HRU18_02790 [Pseudoalteromonas sp.]|uniref:hypothetical protein n=1 Tax=Pseudoalteromonas sp. TaxID=53249 RepID=UPI001DC4D289|nr:hypothetical protein [Pseudoalteromonas sp.]NRA77111.1 hypothetical protein [Pseudoalteromonas sp.]